ncbi:SDR family oxidoreductase [Flavobacterium sp.]|uniref:SDR family NAD(P)-dependent oxidoreductase n=1 Tax=Flavobacterium sp. TaxID=239 RepID=UPI0012138003|nr:SDR family oxidoreductase [Flavobacterium sp.]RZJ73692.1 MAG: SDR family oxidoreductase [Flavobacterium sp.]
MQKKTFIIAGGTSGIGQQITKKLLEKGNAVLTISRKKPEIEDPEIEHFEHDFLSDAPLPKIETQVDGLIYCPGSITLKPIGMLKPEDILNDFKLNAAGAFAFAKAYKANLAVDRNPGILFFSSVAASVGMPFHASVSMAKGAVEGLTLALSAELSPAIRVNCLAPSLTDTPLAQPLLSNDAKKSANAERHPLKRVGTAEEIAQLAVFVLTEATWMTGQIIGINGGLGSMVK